MREPCVASIAKVVLLRNAILTEVRVEQEGIGFREFGCELPPIDFAAFARACGAEGYRCRNAADLRATFAAALASPSAALIEVEVDPDEKPVKAHELKV